MFSAFQTFGRLGAGARAVSAAWSPLALWPLGATSPGMWIDPPYVVSLFSTSAGTTAISAIGTVLDTSNPVGLALDRKGNLALGPELVTNGDFSSGTTGWSRGYNSVNGVLSVSSGIATYTVGAGDGAYPRMGKGLTGLVVGRSYQVTFYEVAATGAGDRLVVWTSSSDGTGGTPLGQVVAANWNAENKRFVVTATATTMYVFFGCAAVSTGATISIDNISVKEIPGIHLSQATATSRGVASARKNELLGTAALATQNVTTTAIPYTISFGGAGTVTASGTHVGALTNGQTFTPTAGTLTLTIAGSVTTAQLERGSAVTSYQRVGATAADYDASAGPTFIRFDGVDDGLATATFSAGTLTSSMDCLMAVRRDSAGNAVVGLYESVAEANKVFGIAESGSASGAVGSGAGTPTVWVDGVQLTGGTAVTRGTLHTALSAGSWHILELRGLDLSTWTAAGFGKYTSYILNGALGETLLFPSGQDANRDLARAQMAAYFGVTLP